jgi:hypothetical protein
VIDRGTINVIDRGKIYVINRDTIYVMDCSTIVEQGARPYILFWKKKNYMFILSPHPFSSLQNLSSISRSKKLSNTTQQNFFT